MILCYIKIWWAVTKIKRKTQNKNLTSCPSNNVTHNLNGTRSTSRPILNSDSSCQGDNTSNNSAVPPSNEANTPKGRNTVEEIFQATKRRLKGPTKRDKRLLPMIMAIIIAFSFVQLPAMIGRLLILDKPKYPLTMMMLQMISFSDYCINPIIYVFMSTEYRQAYIKLFRTVINKLRRNLN